MTFQYKTFPKTLAAFGAISGLVCYFWQFVLPADAQAFHMSFLRMSVIGWTGMNVVSLILTIVEWAIWGAVIGWLLGWLDGMLAKK